MKIKIISTSTSKKGNRFFQAQILEGEMPTTDTILEVKDPPKEPEKKED